MMNIPANVFLKRADHLGDYLIRFEFTDGRQTEIDFHGFLSKAAQNPMSMQFLDITRFRRFKIDQRADIIWGDWDMCFPFAALYAGDLNVDSLGNRKRVSRKPLGKKDLVTPLARVTRKRASGPKGKGTRAKVQ
jgi:hypothetical protein